MYRQLGIGVTLLESLAKLIHKKIIDEEQAWIIVREYDHAVVKVSATQILAKRGAAMRFVREANIKVVVSKSSRSSILNIQIGVHMNHEYYPVLIYSNTTMLPRMHHKL